MALYLPSILVALLVFDADRDVHNAVLFIFMAPYALVHMYIICEVFVCLRSAPLGVYQQVDWTSFLPHF